MTDEYVFLTEKESMWAEMLREVLEDNHIPCVALPVYGAGMTLRAGVQERLQICVPAKDKPRAEELLCELFSGGEDPETNGET